MQDISLFSDEDLVRLFKKGNEKAFDVLYERYAPRLKRVIYYYINDAEEVEDVFHDVTLRVIRHIESFNLQMAFSSWVYQIAINCSKNHLKKNRKSENLIEREKFRLLDEGERSPSPEETYLNETDMREFNMAVDSLGDKFRDVFMLRYDQGVRYAKISEILKCSERTAKWRMKKAVEKIAQYLKEREVI